MNVDQLITQLSTPLVYSEITLKGCKRYLELYILYTIYVTLNLFTSDYGMIRISQCHIFHGLQNYILNC